MVHVHPTPADDEFIASDFRTALSNALLKSLSNHLLAIAVGSLPSILFVLRMWRSSSTLLITSRLIRALFSLSALVYFPLLALWTSIVLTILTFLLRQTAAVERLLHALCNAVTSPVIDRLLSNPSTTLSLPDLRRDLRHSALIVRKREALVAKVGRRSPLRVLVRVLTDIGIAAAIAALAYVAEARFKDATASSSQVSSPSPSGSSSPTSLPKATTSTTTTSLSSASPPPSPSAIPANSRPGNQIQTQKTQCDVNETPARHGAVDHTDKNAVNNSSNAAAEKRLSRTVVIAILRTEMVSAVLLPFKASVKMYLYGTLGVAAILMLGPIWLFW